MSKLSMEKTYLFVKNCVWDIYTPYLGFTIPIHGLTQFNVINGTDNVVSGSDNIVYLGQ